MGPGATSTPVPMVKHGEMPSLTTTTVSSTADSARTSVSVSPSVALPRPLSPHQATSCHSVFPSAVPVALPSSPKSRLMLQPYSHPLFSIISATTHQIPMQSSRKPPTQLSRRSFPVSTCKVLPQTSSRTAKVTISLSTPLIATPVVLVVPTLVLTALNLITDFEYVTIVLFIYLKSFITKKQGLTSGNGEF